MGLGKAIAGTVKLANNGALPLVDKANDALAKKLEGNIKKQKEVADSKKEIEKIEIEVKKTVDKLGEHIVDLGKSKGAFHKALNEATHKFNSVMTSTSPKPKTTKGFTLKKEDYSRVSGVEKHDPLVILVPVGTTPEISEYKKYVYKVENAYKAFLVTEGKVKETDKKIVSLRASVDKMVEKVERAMQP